MALLFLLIVSMPAGLESVQELEELAVGPGIAADRWSGLYIKGESVGVYCSSHGLPRGGIFYLCKVGEVTCLTPKRGSNSSDGARFTLTNVSVNVSGMYVCIYQMWRSGTFTNATGRETVNINVTGKLPAAHISLDPLPSADPHSRILQCSSPRDFPVTAFLFYQIEKESAIDTIPPLLFDPSEASLATRAIKAEGNYSCRYKVNVCGIVYSSPSSQTLEVLIFGDGQLRLTGGPDLCSGRLEVWHWGSWGTVCRAGWGQAEAEVVCQHLGCGFTSWRSNRRYYGRATGPIWLRKVTCRDTERSLWSCSLWSYNIAEYCSHRNDVEVSCIGQPKEPSVSTARSTWGFIEGENITIQCTCLPLYTGSTFYLSKVNQPRFQLTMMASEAENKVTFIIPNGTISQSGLYLCLYQIQRRGITYNSTASGITVKVHEIASTPMISMDRLTGVYLVGETPVIFCRGLHVKPDRFYLYETTANPVLIDELSPKVWRASFTLDTKNRTGEFRYMCTYRVAVADHYVNSTTSTALKIVVTGELPKPQIYLESPTVFFTQYRKVTCSIVSLFGRAEFYLYKAGTPAHFDSSTANRRTSSTTFSVSNMNRTNSGTYTCRYQVETSGRVINSPWSEPLELDIGDTGLRLVNGSSSCSGLLEVSYGGEWGRVLSGSWSFATGDVVCEDLGCGFISRTSSWPHKDLQSRNLPRKIWLNGIQCRGTESSVWDCVLQPHVRRTYWNVKSDTVVNCSALPMVPSLSLDRGTFLKGNSVKFHCSAYRPLRGLTFYLGKLVNGSVGTPLLSNVAYQTSILTLHNVTSADGGSYACWYQLIRDGHRYNSSISQTVGITVGDHPPKPSIKQSRQGNVYLPGETARLRCFSPYSHPFSVFVLHEAGEENVVSQMLPNRRTVVSFEVPLGMKTGYRNYTCSYTVQTAAGHFHSDVSDVLHLIVTDRIPPPRIGIKPSTDPTILYITLTCTSASALADSTFSLYKEGEGQPVSSFRTFGITANFRISKMRSSNRGYYSCQHQVRLGTQLFNSTHSDRLNVTLAGDTALRLANGANNCSGRVEVFHEGVWGTVCNHSWDAKDGTVVCRHLGCGFVQSVPGILTYGRGSGPIWLKNVACVGTESSLWLCSLDSTYRWSSCQHHKDAAVQCTERPERPYFELSGSAGLFLRDQDVSFVCSAPSYISGKRFQLHKDGELADMSQVTAAESTHSVTFTIVNASEASGGLYSCGYQVQQAGLLYNSSRSSDVNVTIVDQLPKPGISLNKEILLPSESVEVRCIPPSYFPITDILIRKSKANVTETKSYRRTGRNTPVTFMDLWAVGQYLFSCNYGIQVKGRHLNSSWSTEAKATVTDRPPKPIVTLARPSVRFQQFLQVTCRATPAFPGSTFHFQRTGGGGLMLAHAASQRGYTVQFSINNLNSSNTGNYMCWYTFWWLGTIRISEPSEHLRIDVAGDTVLRLSGGSSPCSGELEIQHKRQWGQVCDGFWTRADSQVTCRHLDCGFANTLRWSGVVRRQAVPLILSGVHCVGTEPSLWQCSLNGATTGHCAHSRFAAVNCTMMPEEPIIEQERAGAFISGEVIALRCTARNYYAGSIFYLRKMDEESFQLEKAAPNTASGVLFSLPNARVSNGGLYSCFYQVRRDGKSHNSTESVRIAVRVTEQAPKPLLVLSDRSSRFLVGQGVRLLCRIPSSRIGRDFQLHSVLEGGYVSKANSTQTGISVFFTLTNLTLTSTNYSCRYSLVIAGRLVSSMFSDLVSVIVTDELPMPEFTFVQSSPTYPLEIEATCSASTPSQGGWFYLYKVGHANYTEMKRVFGRGRTVYFRLPGQNPGNYTCQHQVEVSGRMFISSHSETLHVPARDSMKLRLAGGTDGCSGRLEVSYNGQWRRFCNPYWLLPHAEVLCRHLDCGFAASTQSNSSYGPGRGLTVMSWGRCTGSESVPWRCPVTSTRRFQKWCDVYAQCSDHPSSPKIDLRRLNGRFVTGETINVTCSAHYYTPIPTFYLRKADTLEDVPAFRQPGSEGIATFRLAAANSSHQGNYSCMYLVRREGKTYNSTRSRSVEIFVSDRAPEPVLRVSRDPPLFLPGEGVTVSCSAPASFGWSNFYLAIGQQRLAMFSRLPIATFLVNSLVTPGVYNCSCMYQLEISGRTVNSTASSEVLITVTDQLQKPSLIRQPDYPGRTILIRCEAPFGLPRLTFHLSRNSQDQILDPMLAYGRRTYFNFPLPLAANDGDNDYYTCRYSVQSAGRTFTSAESDPLFLVLPERAPEINISLSRPLGSFVLGETVEFSCTTPRHHQGCKYFLYKLGEKTSILSKQAANSTCNATFVMENVTRGAQGNYTCGLQMGQRADIHNSSNSVELTLTDSFPKPLLSMEASSLSLFPGENIILSCEAPAEFEVTGFYLRRNDGEDYVAMEQPLASVASANVTLTDINQSDEGNYTCFYRVVAMGQLRTSQSSDQLQVLLSERLQLRLEQRCLGRVEIYYEKRWGSICGSGWDLRDSTVVCRQLGCGFAEAAVLSGQGSQPALLANVGCHGTEGALWDCLSHTWGARNCSNQEYAAVVCNKDFLPKAALTVLRKSQVFLPGETVNVTCTAPIAFSKMTMYLYQTDGHAREALLSARASEDSATFTVPGVTGTQSGNYTCVYETDIEGDIYTSTQSEALSIMVLDHVQKPIIYGQGPFDTFLRGHGLRIECQAPYELEDLRFYLFKDGGYELSAVASKTASFLFMNISQENEGNFTCLYQVEIAGKVQNTTLSDPLEVTITDVVSEYVNLRLSSGPSPCSGRLEVFYNGAWGTVCKEGWGIANADVVCRDLSCGFAALSTDAAVYGEGGGPIWLHNVRCLGTESSFWLCASRSHQAHSCTHSDDVGVSCTDSPPPPSIWLNRPSGMFLPGDTIVVQCETHSHYRLAGFYLSSQDGEGPFTFQRSGQAAGIATFTAQAINVIEHSRYSCHYGMATAEDRTINSTLSASVLLMVAYVPVNPSLSVDSPLSEFSKGESLTLRCTIPMYRVSTDTIRFQFYQLSQPLVVKGKSPPSPLSSTVFTISSLTPSDGGDYACLYQVERSGRTFNSSYSNSVTVTISDHSNNPTMSLVEPSGVFVLGENVDLTCTSPIRDSETKFCLLKVGRGASPTCLLVGTGHQSITFTLSNVHVTAGGSYACTYEMRKDRKVYKSKASNQVTVSVIEMLPQPSISLSPRWPFFLEGELASIRCIAPEEHAASTCHLGRGQSAQALRSINPGPDGHLCNFLIEKVQLRDQGDYSCHYQAEVSGRMVESRVSVTLHLAVRARPTKPSISASYLAASREYLVNCTSPLIDPTGRIYLYRTATGESTQVRWAQVTGNSVVFRLSNASSAEEGNYTCLSETTEAGRVVRSSLSEEVALPTPGSESQLSWIGFVLGAIIGVFVTCLLTVAYCRIRGYCKLTADSQELQTRLLLSPHEPMDVRDYMDLETRF